jgi:hypothetical protein
MVQNKIIDVRLDAKKIEFLSCYMSYLPSNLIYQFEKLCEKCIVNQ